MSLTLSFLAALLIIFAAPYLLHRVARLGAFLPMVVVQTLTGILLGPSMLGALFPGYYSAIFTLDVITCLNALAWWAVMIFAWLAGIELDLKQVWASRRETAVTAGLALGTPMLLGAAAAVVLLNFVDWVGPQGTVWQMVLGTGMACAVTALPVLMALIEELNWLGTPLGARLLRYASADDILVWIVLALLLVDPASSLRQIGFLAGFVLASLWMRRLIARRRQDAWPLAIIWLVFSAVAADWAGLHFIVGAFLAGVVLDSDWLGGARVREMRLLSLAVLMPVYFLSTGLRTRWGVGGVEVLLGTAVFLAAAIGGKLLGVHLAGQLLDWRAGEASIIGWMLQTKGLMVIVFADVLLDRAIITDEAFTSLVLMATASTALAYPIVRRRLARAEMQALRERQPVLAAGPKR
jgi:Kef-type K+ transport system membrane component KefB